MRITDIARITVFLRKLRKTVKHSCFVFLFRYVNQDI